MTKEELLELYKHRYGVGFSLIFNSLTESEKKDFNDISAEQNVKKWRNEGTLIGRIYNFSKEEKDKYSPFIELNEFYDALLQFWIIKRIVSLKSKQRTEESIQEELAILTSQQKSDSLEFLKKELEKKDKNDYKVEIEFMIECLSKN